MRTIVVIFSWRTTEKCSENHSPPGINILSSNTRRIYRFRENEYCSKTVWYTLWLIHHLSTACAVYWLKSLFCHGPVIWKTGWVFSLRNYTCSYCSPLNESLALYHVNFISSVIPFLGGFIPNCFEVLETVYHNIHIYWDFRRLCFDASIIRYVPETCADITCCSLLNQVFGRSQLPIATRLVQ